MRQCIVITLLPALIGCSGSFNTTSLTSSVSYTKSAQTNYEKGVAELKDENFIEAVKYFTYTKAKFPFSRYATLAELRVADAHFEQEKYVDAIDAYRQFQKFHPTHPDVLKGYSAYQICRSNVRQIPSDWFLIPPSYEKDQGATRDALAELNGFKRNYPRSEYLPKVKELYSKCIRRIADHELYVARFYLDRDRPKATILRLKGLLNKYPDAGVDPEVMLLLGKTYMKLKDGDRARETFTQLIKKYPDNAHAAKAKLYLEYLQRSKS